MDNLETAISKDPSHNQPPNADTIAYTTRFCWKDRYIAVSCETMLGPSKHRSGCSQSAIGWITGPPIEEVEKVPKELKGSATTLWTNQYPGALDSSCICIKRWPSRPSLEREAHWTCKLCLCNSFHGCFVPNSKKVQSVYTLVFVLLEFPVFCKL